MKRNMMAKGASDIPLLRLETMQKFISTFGTSPNLMLMNMFPSSKSPSSSIKWESQRGGRGLTPFVAPGAVAPQIGPLGVAQHEAEAAYWKEKMYFDEEFLNNLRRPGTDAEYQDSATTLARNLANLVYRSDRRKEWMFAQMISGGSFTYAVKGGYKVTVDYDIPADHMVTLSAAKSWDAGGSVDILGDIRDAKIKISRACGGKVDVAICNSTVLKYLAADSSIRAILQKNAFGDGNLYKGNLHDLIGVNSQVVGSLLDVGTFIVYDELYEIRAWLTAAVTGGSTTWISVDETADFKVGSTLRFNDKSEGTYEESYILAVDEEMGAIQVSSPPASSYKAAEDYVTMVEPFIPDDKFIMMASRVDNQPIAEYKQAPFGLGRHYGRYTDRDDAWDPDGVYVRVQDKGLPVLYQRDALYVLDVKVTSGQAATSTTTTTSSTTSTTTTA